MAATVLTNSLILVGGYELASVTGRVDMGGETEIKDADHLAGGGWAASLPGLHRSTAQISGMADFAAGGPHTVFGDSERGAQLGVSIVPKGTTAAAGDVALFNRSQLAAYKALQGSIGDVAGFSAMFEGDQPMIHGQVGAALASRSGAFTGSAVQLGAVATGPTGVPQRLWAALHVTAATGTNLAVTIQSDNASGFPSPATALTFSTVSAIGWQFSSVAGPLTDDWFRVSATTGTGSFTWAVLMGVW